MFFKYEFTVSDLGLTPTSEHYRREYPLRFDYGHVRVEIWPPTEEEQAVGHQSWSALGEAAGEFEPPKRVGPMFEPLSRDELPEGSTPDESAPYFDRERGNSMWTCIATPYTGERPPPRATCAEGSAAMRWCWSRAHL